MNREERKIARHRQSLRGCRAPMGCPGWKVLMETLAKSVEMHERTLGGHRRWQVGYVKEKFGGVRIESEGGDGYVRALERFVMRLSHRTCQECGRPGKSREIESWISTLCDGCHAERTLEARVHEKIPTLDIANELREGQAERARYRIGPRGRIVALGGLGLGKPGCTAGKEKTWYRCRIPKTGTERDARYWTVRMRERLMKAVQRRTAHKQRTGLGHDGQFARYTRVAVRASGLAGEAIGLLAEARMTNHEADAKQLRGLVDAARRITRRMDRGLGRGRRRIAASEVARVVAEQRAALDAIEEQIDEILERWNLAAYLVHVEQNLEWREREKPGSEDAERVIRMTAPGTGLGERALQMVRKGEGSSRERVDEAWRRLVAGEPDK